MGFAALMYLEEDGEARKDASFKIDTMDSLTSEQISSLQKIN